MQLKIRLATKKCVRTKENKHLETKESSTILLRSQYRHSHTARNKRLLWWPSIETTYHLRDSRHYTPLWITHTTHSKKREHSVQPQLCHRQLYNQLVSPTGFWERTYPCGCSCSAAPPAPLLSAHQGQHYPLQGDKQNLVAMKACASVAACTSKPQHWAAPVCSPLEEPQEQLFSSNGPHLGWLSSSPSLCTKWLLVAGTSQTLCVKPAHNQPQLPGLLRWGAAAGINRAGGAAPKSPPMELSWAKVGFEAAAGLRGLCEERLGLPGEGHGGFQPLCGGPAEPLSLTGGAWGRQRWEVGKHTRPQSWRAGVGAWGGKRGWQLGAFLTIQTYFNC